MKTIVIDAREYSTSTGRYIRNLLAYLPQVDNKHKYIVLLHQKDMASFQPANSRFRSVMTPHKAFSFGEQLGFGLAIRQLKPDLVHFGMVQQPLLYRGKKVTTMHDLTTVRFRNPSKNRYIFWVKQQLYKVVNKIVPRTSAKIITGTEYVKQDIAKYAHINSRKFVVTHEAADTITAKPEQVESLVGKQFIMYTGRPMPHKNLGRLIDAFEKLQTKHPDLHLVLAGKKDILYRRHELAVKRRGLSNVVFTGFVSEGQLRWLYEHTACYVVASLSEGFGLPGLEAMVHGAPVASSNATCLPEVYGDAPLYFDPENVGDMTKTIGKIISDTNTQKKLVSAGKKQAAKYSWKRMAEQTVEVYNQVLSH